MAEHAAHKIDLTNAAWFKLTLPGIVIAVGMVIAAVRYADKIDAHEKRLEAAENAQAETTKNLARFAEAVARIEGRLERAP